MRIISTFNMLIAMVALFLCSCIKPELGEIALPQVDVSSSKPVVTAFYVAPDGNDNNAGTLKSPFKTLEKARDVMRNSSIKKVYLRAGVYPLASTFILTDKDNNTFWSVYDGDATNSAIVDGKGIADVIDILGGSDITIDGLTVRNFTSRGIGVHGGQGWYNAPPFFDKAFPIAARNVITNNIVEHGVIPAPCWDRAGIDTEGNTPNTVISNNVVRNTTGYGIGVWAMQNGDDISGTQIKNNVVLNTGSSTNDGGAIYVIDDICKSTSISVKNNFIRDYGSVSNGTRGIYLDNGLSNAVVEGNVIAGKGSQAIMLHGGSNITVSKNIIDVGTMGDIPVLWCVEYKDGKMLNNKFVNNVILSSNVSQKTVNAFLKSSKVAAPEIRNNIYYDYSSGALNTGGPFGELIDHSPISFNPLISGAAYEVASNSQLANYPFNFVPGSRQYGPKGFVITSTPEFSASRAKLSEKYELYCHAENYTGMSGIVKNGPQVDYCDGGDWLKFEKVDFGGGLSTFNARFAVDKANAGKIVEVRLGSRTGQLVASLKTASTGGFSTFSLQSCAMTQVKGIQDVFIVFSGGSGVGNFDYFKFN